MVNSLWSRAEAAVRRGGSSIGSSVRMNTPQWMPRVLVAPTSIAACTEALGHPIEIVSGKGNRVVDSEAGIARVARHLTAHRLAVEQKRAERFTDPCGAADGGADAQTPGAAQQ